MMNMESRVVNFEDLGRFVNAILQHICHMINCNRQVLATGTRMSTEELCKRIGEYYIVVYTYSMRPNLKGLCKTFKGSKNISDITIEFTY